MKRLQYEIDLLKTTVELRDKRLEAIICERNTLKYDLESLKHELDSTDHDVEKGGSIHSVDSVQFAVNPFCPRIDRSLRTSLRYLYGNFRARSAFVLYVLAVHIICFIDHLRVSRV